MKYKLSSIFAVLVIGISLLTPAAALAEHSSGGNSGSDDTATSTNKSGDDTTEIETENHDRSGRIDKLKLEFKVKLAKTEEEHIKLKCVGAQGVVEKVHTRFGSSVTIRTQAYTDLQKKLDALVVKLKAKSVDTTTLEQQITALKAKIVTYGTDLTAYQQTLADLKAVDCKTDPSGFQAALLAARSAHNTLTSDVLAIRTYMVGTIKPTLETIKKQLESSTSGESN